MTITFDAAQYGASTGDYIALGGIILATIGCVLFFARKEPPGKRVLTACLSLCTIGVIGALVGAILMTHGEGKIEAAKRHFGILNVEEGKFALPGSKPVILKDVLVQTEQGEDYETYEFVIIKKESEGTYIADYVNKK